MSQVPIRNRQSAVGNGDAGLVDALEEQVVHYRRLAKLAQVQHGHVQQNQTDALIAVLTSRQDVLDHIARLERLIAPAKRQWTAFVAQLPADARGRAETLLAETRQLLQEITTSDQNDALVLQQRKLNLGRQLHQATAARQVNRSYGAAAYGPTTGRMDVQK